MRMGGAREGRNLGNLVIPAQAGISYGLFFIPGAGRGPRERRRGAPACAGEDFKRPSCGFPESHAFVHRTPSKENIVVDLTQIKEHAEVIGADGVHVGTVDHVDGDRIKLTKKDSGEGAHEGHHHYISKGLIAGVEGDTVRLSANADVAVTFEEEA